MLHCQIDINLSTDELELVLPAAIGAYTAPTGMCCSKMRWRRDGGEEVEHQHRRSLDDVGLFVSVWVNSALY